MSQHITWATKLQPSNKGQNLGKLNMEWLMFMKIFWALEKMCGEILNSRVVEKI